MTALARSATLALPMNDPHAKASASYETALRRLLGLADYERMAGTSSPVLRANLARMRELAERLGNPQRAVPVVHVAGTKGKGSTAAMIASMLKADGRRVGLFTSPHLHTFRERLRVDGEPLSNARFSRSLDRVWPHVSAMAEGSDEGSPTTFEALTAMAFDLPASENVEVLVLEVGLGGRLDSTNVADAAVDVITSLSLDHTSILGETIEEIAAEKAGIVKSAVPVVIAPQVPEALAVLQARTHAMGARPLQIGQIGQVGSDPGSGVTFDVRRSDLTGQSISVRTPVQTHNLQLPLLGAHQAENAAVAVAAAEAMGVGPAAIAAGIADVSWPGRFEVLDPGPPAVVVDGAHNPRSMAVLRTAIADYLPPGPRVLVFGCSGDKELAAMVDELRGVAAHVVVCASRHPRALAPDRVARAFAEAGVAISHAADVQRALAHARELCAGAGAVVVTGSLFVVAETREAWHGIAPERYPELEPRETAVPTQNRQGIRR
jgi:dihydrofolate synthase/folylpolyglutamate synthase